MRLGDSDPIHYAVPSLVSGRYRIATPVPHARPNPCAVRYASGAIPQAINPAMQCQTFKPIDPSERSLHNAYLLMVRSCHPIYGTIASSRFASHHRLPSASTICVPLLLAVLLFRRPS